MPKIPFDELEIREQTRIRKSTVHNRNIECIGFDTETYLGKCRLLCDSFGQYWMDSSGISIFDFLTRKEYRGKFSFFFNLRFDFQSIIKHLPDNNIYELYFTGYTTFNDNQKEYEIYYINQKMFKICIEHKSYIYYDLANFLEGSLNSLAEKYLGKKKLDIVDATKLNLDLNYWNENINDIIEYCIVDAKLTQELADKFWKDIKDTLNFVPYKPYSKGSISQEYFLYKCYIPTINKFLTNDVTMDIIRHAYNAYSGGRFEILKRGYVKNPYLYDIKSAYPSEIANLIDYNRGFWYKSLNWEDYEHGYWYCNIEYYNDVLSPFMQKIYDLNTYPIGKFKQYLTKHEIEFITNNFKEVIIEPISGYGFDTYYQELPKNPLGYIEYLYKIKEESIEEERRNAYKIIMNSLYGKFIQTVGEHTGKLFNPFWASEITANTRIKLLEVTLDHDNIKHIIGFSTDSIFIDKQIDSKFLGSQMGKWELKYNGDYGVFLMSDVYSIHTNNGDKHKLRGFKPKMIMENGLKEEINVFRMLELIGNDLKFKYKIIRPMNLGECIIQNKVKSLKDLNIWKEDIKVIDINGDCKRIWDQDFKSGKEPMDQYHDSTPILIGE